MKNRPPGIFLCAEVLAKKQGAPQLPQIPAVSTPSEQVMFTSWAAIQARGRHCFKVCFKKKYYIVFQRQWNNLTLVFSLINDLYQKEMLKAGAKAQWVKVLGSKCFRNRVQISSTHLKSGNSISKHLQAPESLQRDRRQRILSLQDHRLGSLLYAAKQ